MVVPNDGQAKIRHFDVEIFAHQQIVALQISVDDAVVLVVQVGHPLGRLQRHPQPQLAGEGNGGVVNDVEPGIGFEKVGNSSMSLSVI